MAGAPPREALHINILEAQLVRIFDSISPTQDVFVQLVCSYEDGTEKVVGRTEACIKGNLRPYWSTLFVCGRDSSRGSRQLKFKVMVEHTLRKEVLCGEGSYELDTLWSMGMSGARRVEVPLLKKGEKTGVLAINIMLQGVSSSAVTDRTPTGLDRGPVGFGSMPIRTNSNPLPNIGGSAPQLHPLPVQRQGSAGLGRPQMPGGYYAAQPQLQQQPQPQLQQQPQPPQHQMQGGNVQSLGPGFHPGWDGQAVPYPMQQPAAQAPQRVPAPGFQQGQQAQREAPQGPLPLQPRAAAQQPQQPQQQQATAGGPAQGEWWNSFIQRG